MIRYLGSKRSANLAFSSFTRSYSVTSLLRNNQNSTAQTLEEIKHEIAQNKNYEPLSRSLKQNNEEAFSVLNELIPQLQKDEDNLNVILERFIQYNFSLINLINEKNKKSISTNSLIEILKKNPARVKSSFELFEDLYLKNFINFDSEESKSLLFNILIENSIKEEENFINVLFIYSNYASNLKNLNSQLIFDFFSEKKVLNLLKLKNDNLLIHSLKSINLAEADSDTIYDLVLLLSNNMESVKTNEKFLDLKILSNITILLARLNQVDTKDKERYDNCLNENITKINNINLKYGIPKLDISSLKSDLSESLKSLKNIIYSYLLKNFSNNTEYLNLREKFLKYISIELNDFKTFNEYYNELFKLDKFNKENMQLLMNKVLCIKSINEPTLVIWDQLIDVMVPNCINKIEDNINNYIDIPMINEEIRIARRYFELMIIHKSFKNIDDSIGIFNNIIEDFKKLDDQRLSKDSNKVEKSNCTYLVDSLIKAALLNKQRELAFVILEKSIQNNLVPENSANLKSNFKVYGELIEDKEVTDKYANYIKTYISNI